MICPASAIVEVLSIFDFHSIEEAFQQTNSFYGYEKEYLRRIRNHGRSAETDAGSFGAVSEAPNW